MFFQSNSFRRIFVKVRANTGSPTLPLGLLHPSISLGGKLIASICETSGLFWFWLFISGTAMILSAYSNFQGFSGIFPGRPVASFALALMLEGFVVGTGVLLRRATLRALPGLSIMALLFAGTSVVVSTAGFSGRAEQYQHVLDRPAYDHEDALNAEKMFAAGEAQTEHESLTRIVNEIHFIAVRTPKKGDKESGYVRDLEQRQLSLNALRTKWSNFNLASSLNQAKTTGQIWAALQGDYAALVPLVAETSKLTSGKASIPLPGFPVPSDHLAADAHNGITDQSGMNSLRHPTLLWIVIIPIAVIMDFGPMLTAATMRVLETSAGGLAEAEDFPISFEEDWAERERRRRRVGDDPLLDPLADSCDTAIRSAVELCRTIEGGALKNLIFMRHLELFEEEVAVLRDGAERIGIGPAAVQTYLEEAFSRLLKRLQSEQELQDEEHRTEICNQKATRKLQGMKNNLVLAKQIAEIQTELDTLTVAVW